MKSTATVLVVLVLCLALLPSCSPKRIAAGTLTLGMSELSTDWGAIEMVERVDEYIKKYHQSAGKIRVGDSKQKVLSTFPKQSELGRASKSPEQFVSEGRVVDILYFRSGRDPDWRTTDNEFTPYLFIDDKLHAIGWRAIRAFVNQE